MYIPLSFRIDDLAVLVAFVERFSFATLISTVDEAPFASHLPLLLDRERRVLLGHVARANPHWRAFDGVAETLAVFQGPHSYVSPTSYVSSPAVPTWNYAAVHVYGTPRVVEETVLAEIVDRTVARYESGRAAPWAYALTVELRRTLLQSIVGFELPIARIEGKFKFGQNRSAEDQRSMLADLETGDAESQALAAFIREIRN